MRFQLILLGLMSLSVLATSDAEMRELFTKYNAVMDQHQVELIDEVFTRKFITDAGGKQDFIENIKTLPKRADKSASSPRVKWSKGVRDELWLASPVSEDKKKNVTKNSSDTQFIVVQEDGKLKIDGTVSDGH